MSYKDKKFLAKVYITLKPGVNDPQGLTIKNALNMLGFVSVKNVRAGKFFLLFLEDEGLPAAEGKVEEMCRKLLANPVIEQFEFKIEEI